VNELINYVRGNTLCVPWLLTKICETFQTADGSLCPSSRMARIHSPHFGPLLLDCITAMSNCHFNIPSIQAWHPYFKADMLIIPAQIVA